MTAHRSSPWAPHQPKLARNSGTRTLCSTPKRCNSNGVISMFEIHVGELRATFLRNHNMRRHKRLQRHHTGPQAEDNSSPEEPHNPDSRQNRQQHEGATPDQGRCTRYVALHPIWGAAPVTWRCTRYVAVHPNRRGVLPTDRVHRPLEQVKVWSVCAEVTASHSGEDCLVTVACGLVCRR